MSSGETGAPAILLERISKVYRLYERPAYKLLDLFGLCPSGPEYYREHAALRDVSMSVRRGEKVAVIGRNGAGKSTLLKVVTGGLQPTSGQFTVTGRISPLLQIGTGFHGDFSGRQNVYASLAHMGVTGEAADRCFDGILEFSELEAFIDQPMKTYSTGMAARLMFSTATAVDPDILVIDELLGVGDGYFSHKSFERMRRMCEQSGTTLLLVTHDLYAAMNLCERFLWIDRGAVQFEGNGRETVAAYEASIKAQEEERLRRRHHMTLGGRALPTGLRVLVRSRSGFALDAPLALSRMQLVYEDGLSVVHDLAVPTPGWSLLPEGNLGAPTSLAGRTCRVLEPYGAIFHKAEWAVSIPRSEGLQSFALDWLYEGRDLTELVVSSDAGDTLASVTLTPGPGWQHRRIPLDGSVEIAHAPAQDGQYGSGAVRMAAVRWLDGAGGALVEIRRGSRLVIEVDYVVMAPDAPGDVTFAVTLQRAGSTAAACIARDRVSLPARTGTLRAVVDPLTLSSGSWMASIGIGLPDLYKQPFVPYFTVNPDWFHFVARGWELSVTSAGSVDPWAFVVLEAEVGAVGTPP